MIYDCFSMSIISKPSLLSVACEAKWDPTGQEAMHKHTFPFLHKTLHGSELGAYQFCTAYSGMKGRTVIILRLLSS